MSLFILETLNGYISRIHEMEKSLQVLQEEDDDRVYNILANLRALNALYKETKNELIAETPHQFRVRMRNRYTMNVTYSEWFNSESDAYAYRNTVNGRLFDSTIEIQ